LARAWIWRGRKLRGWVHESRCGSESGGRGPVAAIGRGKFQEASGWVGEGRLAGGGARERACAYGRHDQQRAARHGARAAGGGWPRARDPAGRAATAKPAGVPAGRVGKGRAPLCRRQHRRQRINPRPAPSAMPRRAAPPSSPHAWRAWPLPQSGRAGARCRWRRHPRRAHAATAHRSAGGFLRGLTRAGAARTRSAGCPLGSCIAPARAWPPRRAEPVGGRAGGRKGGARRRGGDAARRRLIHPHECRAGAAAAQGGRPPEGPRLLAPPRRKAGQGRSRPVDGRRAPHGSRGLTVSTTATPKLTDQMKSR
jgi:hypothetical protein